MTITYKMDFLIEDLSEDRVLGFAERFVTLVEEFGCFCGGGLVPYKDDDEEEENSMTEQDRLNVRVFVRRLLSSNYELYELREFAIHYLKEPIVLLPFVKVIIDSLAKYSQDTVEQAQDLFASDLMELAEQYEHNNGLSQNLQ